MQIAQTLVELIEGVAHPELDIGDDLIVAAAAGVQLAADIAQTLDQGAFDVRVDVFELDGEREVAALDLGADGVEGRGDGLGLVGGRAGRPRRACGRGPGWRGCRGDRAGDRS